MHVTVSCGQLAVAVCMIENEAPGAAADVGECCVAAWMFLMA